MAFDNLSFEDESATVTGLPATWTYEATAAAQEVASFDRGESLPEQPGTRESFDGGWGVDSIVIVFDDPPNLLQLEFAVFDATLPGGDEGIEDFEEAWSGNHFFIFEFGSGDPAQFDTGTPEDVENFEHEWSANELFEFAWADVTSEGAQFDTGSPESVEDFEEDWSANQLFDFDWSGVTSDAATFDDGVGGTPEDVEDFEEVLIPFTVTALVGSDELVKASHGLTTGQIVTLSNAGGFLPAPLAPGVEYFVSVTSANEFQLSATSGGPAIDLTDAGTGTHTCEPDGSVFWTQQMVTV